MPYAERAYFDHDHCAHCAARDEALRLAYRLRQCVNAAGRNRRR